MIYFVQNNQTTEESIVELFMDALFSSWIVIVLHIFHNGCVDVRLNKRTNEDIQSNGKKGWMNETTINMKQNHDWIIIQLHSFLQLISGISLSCFANYEDTKIYWWQEFMFLLPD